MSSTKPRRILMLLENESYPEDTRVYLEAEALTQAGHLVSVICPTSAKARLKSERVGSVQVYRYPHPPAWNGLLGYVVEYSYSLGMQFCISCMVAIRPGFDAIHLHAPPDMNAVIPALFKLLGKKFVYDLHDLSPELYRAQRNGQGHRCLDWLLRKFERFAARTADVLIATNETQRDIQVQRGGADPTRCHVVRNGPNEAFLRDVPPKPELREVGCVHVGYVGVIGVQDGVDYLVRATEQLVHHRGRRDLRVIIVGDGPALGDIRRLVDSLHLTPYFLFTGMVPFAEVPRYIASFDICSTPDPINPYNDSCTTIKTMEYMALGKPVVCFQTKENEITAGEAAVYARNNSVQEYATLLEQLMDDPERRRVMGAIGRARVESRWTWNHQAQSLRRAYDQLFGTTH